MNKQDDLERAARTARVLIDAALANHDIQAYLRDLTPPRLWTVEGVGRNPTCRVEWEHVTVIAGIGEALAAAKHKNWGRFLGVSPLRPDDPVHWSRILYVYKPTSPYNRRVEQRHALKRLLDRAQDILPKGKLATSGKVFIEPPDTSQGTGAKLKPGDLMIVITGATVGRVAVYPPDSEPGYVSQHVAICRIDPAHLAPRFALQGLLSPYGQEQILGQRYGQGKPGLNLTNIRNLRLPVPPLPVQQRVVEYLDHLEERTRQLNSQQAESKEEVEALLPAILDRAFRGEL